MTAYLQRGDKIHLDVPLKFDHELIREIRQVYEKLGVTVFLTTMGDGSAPMVVSVIRAMTTPRGRGDHEWVVPMPVSPSR